MFNIDTIEGVIVEARFNSKGHIVLNIGHNSFELAREEAIKLVARLSTVIVHTHPA